MLAFAKDISKNKPAHPEESKTPKLKEYMDYQRKLNHEKLIYHALDHSKTYLQKNMEDFSDAPEKMRAYINQAFPMSASFIQEPDTLLLMLRKLVNAHNSTNNWYRMNPFYHAVVYDCLERFVKIYNRLVKEKPDKAREYSIAEGVELDFDDWVQLYFHELDFMIGKNSGYTHFSFKKRNRAIAGFIEKEMRQGKSREDAVNLAKANFEMDPASVKIILGQPIGPKDLELFYTSAENPIYEYLYETDSPDGFLDGESLIDHSYYLGHQLKGQSEEEAESALNEAAKLKQN